MIELYIEDSLVELTDDIIINQTYETLDPEKLSSIKNSFSKTVDIPGTPNNNNLFGDIFRIDRYIPSGLRAESNGETHNRNYQYDPHKKANYLLMKNGSVVNRGYCTLDNIMIKSDTSVTYKLTLYGGIGEFFYSLAYNEYGSPKTLYDMHWAWKHRNFESPSYYDDPMTPEQEDNDVIMDCTTRNVNMAYHLLKPLETIYYDGETYEHWGESGWWYDDNTAYHITDIDKDVVFVPCYTGTYEDFDSKKMLVSTFNQRWVSPTKYITDNTAQLLSQSFPDVIRDYGDDPNNPTLYYTMDKKLDVNGRYRYGIATFSRDLDPWEAGDIRLNEMPVAIRLSKLMRTLSEPFNNGGYEVEWNQEILDSPYWNYSWVMLGKMKQDRESFYEQLSVTANEFNSKYVSLHYKNEPNMLNGSLSTISQSETNYGDEYEIFNTNLKDDNYKFMISLKPIAEFNVNPGTFDASNIDNLFNGWYYFDPGTPPSSSGNHTIPGRPFEHRCRYNYPTLVYNVYEEGILKYSCAFAFFLTNLLNSDQLYLQPTTAFKSNLEQFLDHTINQIKIYKVPVEVLSITSTSIYDHIKIIAKNIVDCDFNIPGNISGNITIKQQFVLTATQSYYRGRGGSGSSGFVWGYNSFEPARSPETFFAFTRHTWPPLTNSNTNNTFTYSFSLNKLDEIGISTTNTTGFNTLKLTKHMLFAESKSPLKYLADLIKMMNWRVTADNMTKKIYIDPLKKFYNGRILDINDKVDYNRDINIKNITTTAKRINFGLENLDTYPVSLYNRINRDKFNLYHYDTGIEYNTSETGLLDNLIYKSTLDWQQNSIFYNIIKSNTGDGYESGQFPKAYNTPTISWTLFNTDEYDPNEGAGSIKRFEKIVPGCSSSTDNLLASNDWLPKISLFNKENKFVEPDTTLIFLNGFVANYDYYKVEEVTDSNSVTNSYYSVFPRFSISEDTYEQYYFCGGRCYIYDFKYDDQMATWGLYSSVQKGTAFSCAMPFFTRELYNLYESEIQTENVKLQPTNVGDNQYFSYENNTYLVHADPNWEIRRYDIDLSTMSNLKFTAHYPADQTGQVLMKFTNYGGAIGAEGTFGPAQHDFVDSTINVSNDLSTIYMNVWKGNTDTTYITADVETTLPPEWRYKNEIIASWNLVGQDNILSMYNLDKTRFLKNPEFWFLKRADSSKKQETDENEYTIYLPTFMSNTIFYNNWIEYMNDLYDRNTRDVTLYIDLSSYGNPNDIMRTIFQWQGFYWVPMKIENFKTSDLGQDKFTKCTIHKIKDISTWLE